MHYDTSYTLLRWNISAAPLAVPGTARVSVVPYDAASATLAKNTRYVWWFRYRFAGYDSRMRPNFIEDPSIELRLLPPHMDLSVSEPGIYFVGIFGSFSGSPEGSCSGFVSHPAPMTKDAGFQPFALIIPYGAHAQNSAEGLPLLVSSSTAA